jgi:hypothetical protein
MSVLLTIAAAKALNFFITKPYSLEGELNQQFLTNDNLGFRLASKKEIVWKFWFEHLLNESKSILSLENSEEVTCDGSAAA